MNEIIDTELKKSIQGTLDAVKQMIPVIRQEVRSIINNKSNSELRIERALDTLLNYLHWGFGQREFCELNDYYFSIEKKHAIQYRQMFNDMMDDNIVDPLVIKMKDPEPIRLDIENEPLEKIKVFMKTLFETDIPGNWRRFVKLDLNGDLERITDPEMSYDTFIENIGENKIIHFEINRLELPPANPSAKVNVIRLFMGGVELPGSKHVERLAWHCSPVDSGYFKDHPNYKRVDDIFKGVFNTDMDSYESPRL
ncbi:MAG: hypothetical protein NT166_31445 [Candidatus Aminicenantes bacterium]|nr:hypothetical protein [Candidatus Aminicenantes bacterium]